MSRVVIASNNPGKLREFSALLAPLGWETVGQGALGIGEADEPHPTFVENALGKARHASAAAGLPAIADDSGLCVTALGGAPGVRSARWAEVDGDRAVRDAANNAKLVARLAGVDDRAAYFVACLVFVRHADDPEPIVATARWHGRIVDVPSGAGGFGYDAHFWLPDRSATAAELDPATKNALGHRGRALRALVDAIAERDASSR